MERIFKDYLPKVERLDINQSSKDYQKQWEPKVGFKELENMMMLR